MREREAVHVLLKHESSTLDRYCKYPMVNREKPIFLSYQGTGRKVTTVLMYRLALIACSFFFCTETIGREHRTKLQSLFLTFSSMNCNELQFLKTPNPSESNNDLFDSNGTGFEGCLTELGNYGLNIDKIYTGRFTMQYLAFHFLTKIKSLQK